ncbi:MAG: hypothetical protein WCK96_11570 [Methylococcales bacterium]
MVATALMAISRKILFSITNTSMLTMSVLRH